MSNQRYRYNIFALVLIILIITPNITNLLGKTNSNPELFHNDLTTQDTTLTIVRNQTDFTLSKKYEFDDRLGAMKDIMIQDNLAFVAVQWGGLVIFDISDLENPVKLGSYYEPIETITDTGLTSGVFVKDDVAFVADGYNGLVILNVSNPQAPSKIGQYQRAAFRIFVENNYAYIRSYNYLVILDISNLSSPFLISEEEYIGIREIHVKEGIVFLPRLTSTLVVNATNPSSQEIMMILNNTQVCRIQDDFLFTARTSNELVIYNLTTLPTLTVVANYTLPLFGTAKYLCINDEFAYIGSTEEVVKVVINNITSPYNISKLSNLNWYYNYDSYNIKRSFTTLSESKKRDIVLFTDYQRGLFIYNTSSTAEDNLIGYYDCGMRAELVRVKGKYVYVASRAESPYYPSKLEIFTLTDDSLQKVGSYHIESSIWDLDIVDDVALLTTYNLVDVVDLSDPTNPSRISYYYHLSGPYPNWNLFYDEEHRLIYLCGDSDGLLIIDASDFANLTLVSQVNDFHGYPFRAFNVYVNNDIAFVADGQLFGGFGIINVTDPRNPLIINYTSLNRYISGVVARDDLVYITSDYRTLEIYNVSDLSNPFKLSEYDNNGWSYGRFNLQNGICFVVQQFNLTLINITDSSHPHLLGFIEHPLSSLYVDLMIEDSLLYLACAWGGIEVWQLPINPQRFDWIKPLLFIALSFLGFSFVLIIALVIWRRKEESNI
ncbi:MAG: hypothetical protein JJE41_16010 [Candidatus Heimdallarchaeota archaeon]|nr:hypothetical protein [Candidatus Heimdallarchaeota archaeon]